MGKRWQTDFEIVWHGDVPEGVEGLVRDDMLVDLTDLSKPSDLVFHTVFLGDDFNGPVVTVWGERRDRRFHAEYVAEPEWITGLDMEHMLP